MPAKKRIKPKLVLKTKKPKGNIRLAKMVKVDRSKPDKSNKLYQSASRDIASAVKNLQTFTNPTYTDTELEYFEDAWANSVAGTAMDKKMEFVMGRGVKPTFELIEDKDMSPEQKEKALKKYDDQLDELIQLDQRLGFNQKLFDAAIMAKVFGRCVLTWEQ